MKQHPSTKKIGPGILRLTAFFGATMIIVTLLVLLLVDNFGFSRYLQTHLDITDDSLKCLPANLNLPLENLITTTGTGTTALRAFLTAKNKATEQLKIECTTGGQPCNDEEVRVRSLNPDDPDTIEINKGPDQFDFHCPDNDNWQPVTNGVCRPLYSQEENEGFPAELRFADDGTIVRDRLFPDHCEVEGYAGYWQVNCDFKGICRCQRDCINSFLINDCEVKDKATGPTECKGATGNFIEGPVNGKATTVTSVLTPTAQTDLKNDAVEDAKANLRNNCKNWNTIHSTTSIEFLVNQPDCRLDCAIDCMPDNGHGTTDVKSVVGNDNEPIVNNISCTKVTISGTTNLDGQKEYTANAIGCFGYCLLERNCKPEPPPARQRGQIQP